MNKHEMRLPIFKSFIHGTLAEEVNYLRKELNTPHTNVKIFNTFDKLITNPEIIEDRFWRILLSAG
jgi:hypothetical protein